MGPVLSCCSAQLRSVVSRSLGVKLAPWEGRQEAFGWPRSPGLSALSPLAGIRGYIVSERVLLPLFLFFLLR